MKADLAQIMAAAAMQPPLQSQQLPKQIHEIIAELLQRGVPPNVIAALLSQGWGFSAPFNPDIQTPGQ